MIIKLSDNWYMLTFHSDDGRFAAFGYNEEAVKGKFATWYRNMYMAKKIIPRPVDLYEY